MCSVNVSTLYKSVVSFAQITACAVALAAAPNSATAATLEDYYRTIMTIRACEMVITEEDWDKLTSAVEEKVANNDTSSETVNGIFQQVGNEMRDNLENYCADNTAAASAVIADLPYWVQ